MLFARLVVDGESLLEGLARHGHVDRPSFSRECRGGFERAERPPCVPVSAFSEERQRVVVQPEAQNTESAFSVRDRVGQDRGEIGGS